MEKLLKVVKNNKVIIASEVLLFLISALGIGVASLKLIAFRFKGLLPPPPPLNFVEIILALALSTLFVLLISIWLKHKSRLKNIFFKIIFSIAVYLGSIIFLALWLPGILAPFLGILLLIGWFLRPFVWLHDLILILALTGLSAFLGIGLNSLLVLGFLILMSVYDFIAVYKTKHMVFIAKEMIEAGSPLAFILPQKLSGFLALTTNIKVGENFIFLGSGDIALPLLLMSSLLAQNLTAGLIIGIFSLLGLLTSLFLSLSQIKRQPMPALPPIALACTFGYLISHLLIF